MGIADETASEIFLSAIFSETSLSFFSGVSFALGWMPEPASGIELRLPAALCAILRYAVRTPVALGVKLTVTVHA